MSAITATTNAVSEWLEGVARDIRETTARSRARAEVWRAVYRIVGDEAASSMKKAGPLVVVDIKATLKRIEDTTNRVVEAIEAKGEA